MEREKAFALLKRYVSNANLIKHSLSVESCMRDIAQYLGQDEKKWGLCGLIHDLDYEIVKGDMRSHGIEGSRILKENGFEEDICDAVISHNDFHGVPPSSLMAKALLCVDPTTGLIVAATLVLPSKKIYDLKVENMMNRFKEKNFAKGARRDLILKCKEYLGIELQVFFEICINAMGKIAADLGL